MTKHDRNEFIRGLVDGFAATVPLMLLALLLILCGCTTTRYVPMPEYHTETIRTDTAIYNAILRTFRESVRSNQRSSDSVVHLNKETVTLNEHGDTTRHDKTEYIYLSSYKEREYKRIINEQRDSIGRLSARLESQKADSVSVPYPVERIVEIERDLAWWELGLMAFGGVFLLLIGYVVYLKCRKVR